MNNQGAGYRDYGNWRSSRTFSKGLNETARFFATRLGWLNPRVESLHTFFFRGARNYRSMPVVRVNDFGATGISVLRPFPREHGVQVFVHSNDHAPPHIHAQALWPGKRLATRGRI
jgi:hypothetical protein